MRTTRSRTFSSRSANALVEFAVLLPIYLLLFFGTLYVGRIALFQERSIEANRLAASLPGDQTETARQTGPVSGTLFQASPGTLSLKETHELFPGRLSIADALFPPPPPERPRRPRAVGYTDIDLDTPEDDLETEIDPIAGRPGSPPEPPARDAPLIHVVHNLMKDWAVETHTDSEYVYDPGYLSLRHLKFDPVKPRAKQASLARSSKVRRARMASGESASPELINQLNDGRAPVPGFPDFGKLPPELLVPN